MIDQPINWYILSLLPKGKVPFFTFKHILYVLVPLYIKIFEIPKFDVLWKWSTNFSTTKQFTIVFLLFALWNVYDLLHAMWWNFLSWCLLSRSVLLNTKRPHLKDGLIFNIIIIWRFPNKRYSVIRQATYKAKRKRFHAAQRCLSAA